MARTWQPEERHRKVRDCIAEMFGVEPHQLPANTRVVYVAKTRQAAYWILGKVFPELSTTMIGRVFGGRHHASVHHGLQQVEQRRERDPAFAERLDAMIVAIGRPPQAAPRELVDLAEIAQRRLPDHERGEEFASLFKKSADPDEVTRAIAADVEAVSICRKPELKAVS